MYHTIVCIGDSNTYGYDPRSFLGDRYPPDLRWTGLLHRALQIPVENLGQNGRCIPRAVQPPLDLLPRLQEDRQLLLIMLGTNDLLQNPGLAPEAAADRMARFLQTVSGPVLLIAPPPMVPGAWVSDPRLPDASRALAACYQALAARMGVDFADSGAWGVELLFDGVHFSPAGHRAFAAGLIAHLRKAADA